MSPLSILSDWFSLGEQAFTVMNAVLGDDQGIRRQSCARGPFVRVRLSEEAFPPRVSKIFYYPK